MLYSRASAGSLLAASHLSLTYLHLTERKVALVIIAVFSYFIADISRAVFAGSEWQVDERKWLAISTTCSVWDWSETEGTVTLTKPSTIVHQLISYRLPVNVNKTDSYFGRTDLPRFL